MAAAMEADSDALPEIRDLGLANPSEMPGAESGTKASKMAKKLSEEAGAEEPSDEELKKTEEARQQALADLDPEWDPAGNVPGDDVD